MALTVGIAAAYSRTGAAWDTGPALVYDRLAEVLVGASPVAFDGLRVLDVGAGTGAAGRAATAAGAERVTAVDAAFGMLRHGASGRCPAAVGDALALPFRDSAFDASMAAFSLNHLPVPALGFREMARVTRPGGPLLTAAYASDDTHPVKAAVEAALTDRGWAPETWYEAVRDETTRLMAEVAGYEAISREAGMPIRVERLEVPFPELGAEEMVAWRLGLAQHAPFVADLSPGERSRLESDAAARLGERPPPLVRSIVVAVALSP